MQYRELVVSTLFLTFLTLNLASSSEISSSFGNENTYAPSIHTMILKEPYSVSLEKNYEKSFIKSHNSYNNKRNYTCKPFKI